MSIRRVQIVILCEDSQHEAFIRRFLTGLGWNNRAFRIEKSPSAVGSAEQYVKGRFPKELLAYRERKNKAASALIVMLDADNKRVQERINELESSCQSTGIEFRTPDEAVAIGIPKRNIETWIHYLNGNQVNEQDSYPKLEREKECKSAVNNLIQLCRTTGLKNNAPQSLVSACDEYRNRIIPIE